VRRCALGQRHDLPTAVRMTASRDRGFVRPREGRGADELRAEVLSGGVREGTNGRCSQSTSSDRIGGPY
jgi:hypothetical protein